MTTNKTIPVFGAVDKDNNYTTALIACKGEHYTCPICYEPVTVAEGNIRQKYLRHKYKRDKGCSVYDAPTVEHSNTIQQIINKEIVRKKLASRPLHVKQYCKNKPGCCLGDTRLLFDDLLTDFTNDGVYLISEQLFEGQGLICYNTLECVPELEVLSECVKCVENRLLFRETVGDNECITQCDIIQNNNSINQFNVWDKFGKKFCLAFERIHFDLIDNHYRAETLPWIYKLKPKGNLKIDMNIDRRHYDETDTIEDRIASYNYPPINLENCNIILVKDCNYFNDDWIRWIINNQPVRDGIKDIFIKKPRFAPIVPVLLKKTEKVTYDDSSSDEDESPIPIIIEKPQMITLSKSFLNHISSSLADADNWEFVPVKLPFKFKDEAKKIFNGSGSRNLSYDPTTKWSVTRGNLRHFDVIPLRYLTKQEYDIIHHVLIEPFNPKGYTTVRFRLLGELETKKKYSRNKFILDVIDTKYYNDDYVYEWLV